VVELGVEPAVRATPGTVTIDLTASPVVSLAMAHNDIRPVQELRLTNTGPAIDGAEVSLTIRDAEGVLSRPCTLLVDLPEQGHVVVDDVDLRVDAATLLDLEERRSATLSAVVSHGDRSLASAERDVTVLAGRQWLGQPLGLGVEMLAAHVMPNSPQIETLLGEAAAILRDGTGSSAIEGYQSGPERVDQIVRAVYEAMQARNIRYASPPASWSEVGQKIRTPEEVLDGRVGTCLDTAVVLAAGLEQAGIRPLIWVVQGHAFVGYWREEFELDGIASSDASPMVNLLDLGVLNVVETTLLTEGKNARFDDAVAAAREHAVRTQEVLGILDVQVARRNGIVALPSRRRLPTGDVQVIEYHPVQHSTPMPQFVGGATAPSPADASRAQEPARVTKWKNSLLDLSLRNRLINFSTRYAVELVVPPGKLGTLEDLVHSGRQLRLLPSDHVDAVYQARGIRWGRDLPAAQLEETLARSFSAYTDVSSATYATRLRSLAFKARTIEEETGANNLYLALGTLVWELDGRSLDTPLILVPVKLKATGRGDSTSYRLSLDEAGGSTPNYCLLEKLKQTHGLTIPELAEPKEDLSGIDLDETLRAVRSALVAKGLPFHVRDTAHLSILQFAKFRLWKDLDENWEELLKNPLATHLAHTPTEEFVDPAAAGDEDQIELDELAAKCPIPADASQLRAVAEALKGRTFVLEGPPGTGKSQTITNLLARCLAEGKRVMFVAEKRAALDVVKTRMDQVGLGPFSLDLHDKGSKPAAVRAQIKEALEHRAVVDQEGLSAAAEELATATRALRRYRDRLHEQNGAGLSLYCAHTRQLALSDVSRPLPVPERLLTTEATPERERIRSLLVSLPDVAAPARPRRDHPWGMVRVDSVADPSWDHVVAAARTVTEIALSLPDSGRLGRAVLAAKTVGDLESLTQMARAQRPPLELLDETQTPRWQGATSALQAEVQAFAAAAHPGLEVATPEAIHLPLADLHAQARAAASSSWWGRKKRLMAVVEQLQPGLKPGATVHHKQVVELTGALLQVQTAVAALASKVAQVPGLVVPEAWNPLTDSGQQLLRSQVEWLSWAGRQVAVAQESSNDFVPALREFVSSGEPVPHEVVTRLSSLVEALRALQAALGVDEDGWRVWAGADGLVRRWQDTESLRKSDQPGLPSLRRWLELRAHLAPLADAGMTEAQNLLLTGEVEADEAPRAFDRGVADASLRERQAASGLDAFDPTSHERVIDRFASSSTVVRGLLPGQIQREILHHRPFLVGSTSGRIGALQRELEKRRGGLAVRPLLQQYGDLITQLMPCVLVSPDSLARFFPAQAGLFDIVVFDEASQIRVADAIGAIGRAKSVVIVGDSKQMPPTSFAESSIVSDDQEDEVVGASMAVEDQESILSEAVQARLVRHWLSWHYRSQDESLIAFSNRNYYKGRLSSFPAPSAGAADPGADGYGISLVRVNGTFHRSGRGKLLRTNPVEAEAIVKDLQRRFDAHQGEGSPSVGVVTFNQQQRAYIEGLIRDHEDPRMAEALDSAKEGLFVKNLENVQGDERDVILFSTAFSVNERGVLPLNFGPLNKEGGERRLNVAITRARRQVVIYSSFDPSQLRAEETSSLGIKHLKEYLELAAAGTARLAEEIRSKGEVDRHREDVASALRAKGVAVATDVGLSDFRVDLTLAHASEPDRRLVAVILDGPGWAGRQTVGDRDGLPVTVLHHMLGWPAVARVWMPAWLQDPAGVVDRLMRVLEDARRTGGEVPRTTRSVPAQTRPAGDDGPRSVTDESDAPASDDAMFQPIASVSLVPEAQGTREPLNTNVSESPARLPEEAPFEAWNPEPLGPRSTLDDLPASWARQQVTAVIKDVVATEGPIHEERLAKLVAASFDLYRVSQDRANDILRCVPTGWRLRDERDVIWDGRDDVNAWRGFRRSEEPERDIAHIPLREMANAIRSLCRATGGLTKDELAREALGVFGYRRRTPRTLARVEKAMAFAVSAALIHEGSGGTFHAD